MLFRQSDLRLMKGGGEWEGGEWVTGQESTDPQRAGTEVAAGCETKKKMKKKAVCIIKIIEQDKIKLLKPI